MRNDARPTRGTRGTPVSILLGQGGQTTCEREPVSARNQIRSAIVIAVLVVLGSFALLFALSVIGEEDAPPRRSVPGAPIVFPAQDQGTDGPAPTRTPAAIPTDEERR